MEIVAHCPCGGEADIARTVADNVSVLKFTRAGMENA